MLLQQKRLRQARAAAEARLLPSAIAQAKGEKGGKGEKGEKGDTGPMPAHQWQGTKLRFEQQGGAWGKWVDLRGPAGARGGNAGSTTIVKGFDPARLPAAANETPGAFLVRQGETWAVATYAQMAAWLGGSILTEAGDALLTEAGDLIQG